LLLVLAHRRFVEEIILVVFIIWAAGRTLR